MLQQHVQLSASPSTAEITWPKDTYIIILFSQGIDGSNDTLLQQYAPSASLVDGNSGLERRVQYVNI